MWLSIDGGNTFELLADFHDDIIKNTYHSFYTSDITFVSQSGNVYLTKAGEKFSFTGEGTTYEPGIRTYMKEICHTNQLILKSQTN